ncbi:MAG: hypothetical protein WC467_01020 [Patescibacteria group bacterium]
MLSQSFVLRQEQTLTQQQRVLLVQTQRLKLRIALIQELRGETYTPEGHCPHCGRELTAIEILSGFNRDPKDFTTACSACGFRFEPRLICVSQYSTISIPFYCDIQTLDQLRGNELLSPEQLSAEYPGVFRSAVFHHGGIKKAFELIGIDYQFEEVTDWKTKVNPFLGRLPDTTIAENVGVTISTIRNMRKKLNIPRYTTAVTLSEAEE